MDMILGKKVNKDDFGKHFEDYEHRRDITTVLKTIWMCDMSNEIKKIMTLRIWGADPGKFWPLDYEQIAYLRLRCKRSPTEQEINKVKDFEKQGIFMCKQFLLSTHAEEIVDKFNKNFTKNKGHMFAKTPFEQEKFSA